MKDDNDKDWHECLTLMLSVLRVMGVFKEVYVFLLLSVQLDLRNGSKRSLQASPRHCLLLKTCAISPTRPHLLLVGGR